LAVVVEKTPLDSIPVILHLELSVLDLVVNALSQRAKGHIDVVATLGRGLRKENTVTLSERSAFSKR